MSESAEEERAEWRRHGNTLEIAARRYNQPANTTYLVVTMPYDADHQRVQCPPGGKPWHIGPWTRDEPEFWDGNDEVPLVGTSNVTLDFSFRCCPETDTTLRLTVDGQSYTGACTGP